MENIYWKKTVGTLIGAIWLYTLADIAASIAGAVNEILNPSGALGMIKDLMEGGSGAPSLSMGDIIESMFSILVLIGYYLFFRSLTRFARLQSNGQDSDNVSTVRTAYILLVVALLVDFVPLIGWLASFVLIVIAYVKMLSGYRGLKKSYTFPSEARQGAATLYSCTIWTLVAYVLGCIPLVGSVIEGIITLVIFFTILSAWGRIKNGAPEMTPEEEETFRREDIPDYKKVLGYALIAIFLVALISRVLLIAFHYGLIISLPSELDYMILYLLPYFAYGGIYIWLITSRVKFSVYSKLGLFMLLTEILGSIFLMMQESHYTKLDAILMGGNISLVWDILSALCVVGVLLFIWSTRASLYIKIIISLYPILNEYIWRVVWRNEFVKANVLGCGDFEILNSVNIKFDIILLIIIIIYLTLVYYFVSQWRKQPTDINIVNK